MLLESGTLLQNRYEILEKIGRGGMGAVYKAIDSRLGHEVAIKQILHDAEAVHEAFTREARLLAQLRHAGLPRVSDYFAEPAGKFLVMEYIDGEEVTVTADGSAIPYTAEQVIDWLQQLLATLDYLHNHVPTIIHRDIKPQNLRLTQDNNILLLDFGLAKGALDEETAVSVAGYTLTYAPPEQIQNTGTDARSDLYSLGATAYELLTGMRPVNALKRILAHGSGDKDPLTPAHLLNSTIPIPLSNTIHKAMALQPRNRFQSAAAMAQALSSDLHGEQTLVTVTAPPRNLAWRAAAAHNLPHHPTPIIGRDKELLKLVNWLTETDGRLVTITGLGGMGKTRLSIALGHAVLTHFADGVFQVQLDVIDEAPLVIPTIARALNLDESPTKPILDELVAFLQEKELLLILDNFEQVIPAAADIAALLTRCPTIKILVTSREALHIRGEQELQLQPLSLPAADTRYPLDALTQFDAVQLFIERATAAKANFAVNNDNAPAVAEICHRLDGLPLAIELAAARIKMFPPAKLLELLSDRFRILKGGPRDLPARQQTLQAAVDWSYDLLSQGERQLLSRLAVFNGGCHIDAAEAICTAAEEDGLAPLEIDIFDGLVSLLDKSLIRQDEQADEPRYTMLATIHEYATAKLLQSDEAVRLGARHARYFLSYAAEREPQIKKAAQSTILQELATEHGNFRAALSWAIDQQQADIALALAAHLWKFWDIRGHYTDGRQWLTVLLKQFTTKTNPRGRALYGASVLAMRQGDYKTADQYLTESLEIAQQLDDQQLQGLVINMQANLALYKGDFTAAKQLYKETLTLWRQLDLQSEEALALMNLAIAEAQLGNTAEAIKQLEQSLAVRRELKQPREIAETLHNLGEVAMIEQRLAQAKNYLNESLAIRRELKDQWGISYSLHNLGQIAYQEQQFAEAVRLLSESLQIKEGLGEQWGIAYVRYDLGEVARLQGNHPEALRHHQAALQSRAEAGDKPGVWQSLIKIAQLAVMVAPSLAVFLWVAIAQHINAEKQLPSDTLNMLKKQMSAEEFSQASKKGANSSQAEIIQLVLAYTYQ